MTVTTVNADDDIDAFDALESEEKEFIKVMFSSHDQGRVH